MKKNITLVENTNEIFKAQQLTIGLDVGDRISHYCMLDETGNVILEQSVPTTPKGIQQVFSRISRSRIALETGTHSPWLSRLLTQLGHDVIVAHARNVRLIAESSLVKPQQVCRLRYAFGLRAGWNRASPFLLLEPLKHRRRVQSLPALG